MFDEKVFFWQNHTDQKRLNLSRQRALDRRGQQKKGRWSEPAALKHGSAVGRPLPEVAFMP
jgi:hypothetical protein